MNRSHRNETPLSQTSRIRGISPSSVSHYSNETMDSRPSQELLLSCKKRITELQLELYRTQEELDSFKIQPRSQPEPTKGPAEDGTPVNRPVWMLDNNRESWLSSSLEASEKQLQKYKEEADRYSLKLSALQRQLDSKSKEHQEFRQQWKNELHQKQTEISLLVERNELLRAQIQELQNGQSKSELAMRLVEEDQFGEVQRREKELEQVKQKIEKNRHDLEMRETKLLDERDKLNRKRASFEVKLCESETLHLNCLEMAKELENQRNELDGREVSVKEAENFVFKEKDKLKSEWNELANAKQKLQKAESDLANREAKLKQCEADMGRMRRELEQHALKCDIDGPVLFEASRDVSLNIIPVLTTQERKEQKDVAHWKKRFEDSLLVQKTLQEQVKTLQAISGNQPSLLQSPAKRRGAFPKVDSDVEKARSVKAKETVATLKELIENEGGRQARSRRKGRAETESLIVEGEAPIETTGSKRGRKRLATPDSQLDVSTPCDTSSATAASPVKRRRYDSLHQHSDGERESPTIETRRSKRIEKYSSNKKPPLPRTRTAASSDGDGSDS